MKKILFVLLSLSLLISCKSKKDSGDKKTETREKDDYRTSDDKTPTDEKKPDTKTTASWSQADIDNFNSQCLQSLNNDEALAAKVCPCLLGKMQNKYASLADMDQKSSEEEGKRIGEECKEELNLGGGKSPDDNQMSIGGGWPESEKKEFMSSCIREAVAGGNTRQLATRYCECMMDKLESLYPDIKKAATLTDQQLERIMNQYKDKCLE
jgi:hypothetical protein